MKGGVYLYRTLKPAARLRIPFLSTQWGYVGETTSFWHRHQQHVGAVTGVKYAGQAKPWADLVVSVHRIPLPAWKPLLRAVETLLIWLTWPVYNVAKNRWNPRRITPYRAAVHRARRDEGGREFPIWPIMFLVVVAVAILVKLAWRMS